MKIKAIFISFMISIFLLSCGKTEPSANDLEIINITIHEAEDKSISLATEKRKRQAQGHIAIR